MGLKHTITNFMIFLVIMGFILFLGISIQRGNIKVLKYDINDVYDDYIVYQYADRYKTYTNKGLMNHEGEILYKANYHSILFLEHYIFLVNENNFLVVMRNNPTEILVNQAKARLIFYQQYEQMTLIDTNKGDLIIDHSSHEVKKLNNDWMFYPNHRTNIYERVIFEDAFRLKGIMDFAGNTIVEPTYEYIYPFTEDGFAFAATGNETRIIDTNGNVIKSLNYPIKVDSNHTDIVPIRDEDRYGVITIEGDYLIEFEFDYIDLFDHYIQVKKNGKYGLYDLTGEELIEIKYTSVSPVILNDEKFAVVREEKEDWQNGVYGIIDLKSKEMIIEPIYHYINPIILNDAVCAIVELDGLYGIIDMNGETIMPIQYDEIKTLHHDTNEVLAIKLNNKWALFSETGDKLTDFIYDGFDPIYNDHDRFLVNKGNDLGIIDKSGIEITEIKYDSIDERIYHYFDNNFYYGIFNDAGEVIFETNDRIEDYIAEEALIIVQSKKNDYKLGVMNLEGDTVIEFKYDDISFNKGYFWLNKNGKLYKATVDGDLEKIKSRDLYIKWLW
jgi:hypothetical protein